MTVYNLKVRILNKELDEIIKTLTNRELKILICETWLNGFDAALENITEDYFMINELLDKLETCEIP